MATAHVSHRLLPVLLTLSVRLDFAAATNTSPQTLASLDAYNKQEPCATGCFYQYEGACSNDIIGGALGCAGSCISWASNDCYCRTDYQTSAVSYLYTCVSRACTRGSSSIDIAGATSLYKYYCTSLGYIAAAAPTTLTAVGNGAGADDTSTSFAGGPMGSSSGPSSVSSLSSSSFYSSSLSTGAIAGIAVGSAGGAFLLSGIMFLLCRLRARNGKDNLTIAGVAPRKLGLDGRSGLHTVPTPPPMPVSQLDAAEVSHNLSMASAPRVVRSRGIDDLPPMYSGVTELPGGSWRQQQMRRGAGVAPGQPVLGVMYHDAMRQKPEIAGDTQIRQELPGPTSKSRIYEMPTC